jgi:hypothetical protein
VIQFFGGLLWNQYQLNLPSLTSNS